MRCPAALVAVTALTAACGPSEPDPRLATPRATAATVLRATGLEGATGPEPGGRFGFGRRESRGPAPLDLDSLALCFLDFDRDDPASRAMAEVVAGMLAGGGAGLRFEQGRRRARIHSGRRSVTLHHTRLGWRISLAETVPPDIAASLRARPRTPDDDGRELP